MAEELSIDNLKDMSKADFIKAFKSKSLWNKANAVIIFVGYKLNGKKTTVAIPYKREAEMKEEMKRVKKDKIHFLKKTGAGRISFETSGEGLIANIEITRGAIKPELLQAESEELFEKINCILKIVTAADPESEEIIKENDKNEIDFGSETAEKSPEDEKSKLKGLIQELARLQLSLKDQWEQFKEKTKAENLRFTLPLLGKLQISLNHFKAKIDELIKLNSAGKEVQLFLKNYETLKSQLANPALEKGSATLEKVKENTITLVNEINSFIENLGLDAKYKIKL